jgi:hypothetical protein
MPSYDQVKDLEDPIRQRVCAYVLKYQSSYSSDVNRSNVWISTVRDSHGNYQAKVHRAESLGDWARALVVSGRWLDGFSLEIAAIVCKVYVLIIVFQPCGYFKIYGTGNEVHKKGKQIIVLSLHQQHYALVLTDDHHTIPEPWHDNRETIYSYKGLWGDTNAKVLDGCLTDWTTALLKPGRWLDGLTREIAAFVYLVYNLINVFQSDGSLVIYGAGDDACRETDGVIVLRLYQQHYGLLVPTGRSIIARISCVASDTFPTKWYSPLSGSTSRQKKYLRQSFII